MAGGLITASVMTAVAVVATTPVLVGTGSAAAPVVITAPTSAPTGSDHAGRGPRPLARDGRRRERRPVAGHGTGGGDVVHRPATVQTSAPIPSTPPTTARPGPDELAVLNEPQLLAGLQTEAAPANLRPALRRRPR